ncbi:MAG: hypothetical protein ACOY4R_31350 [Pseudomonadota bacterium]
MKTMRRPGHAAVAACLMAAGLMAAGLMAVCLAAALPVQAQQPAAQTAPPAQDETPAINAFAVVSASGTIMRAAEKQLMAVATLNGPFFVETDEGPIPAGSASCVASLRFDQGRRGQTASGACTMTATDGATAWGEWACEGYELLGCRGIFKLTGGTARFEGATGEGAIIWRPSAHELSRQLDGSVLDSASGILLWRDVRLQLR